MAKNKIIEDPFINNSNIPEEVSIENFLHENGLEYARYVITDRALIGDDGTKPVNRRLLYAMYNMGLRPGGKKTKANRIVGETIGKFHPHGNLAVSAALARMGQTFSLRIPLLEVQGSVGFVTGDKPAADRYWEATINKAAYELLKEIGNHGAVMVPTEDGEEAEPAQLPITWPIGIINGSQGIAVGYSNSMAPHNPTEVMNACIAYLNNKIKKPSDLGKYIKGPDFPTGGELIGIDGVKDYFETGSGTFTIRGKYNIIDLPRGRKSIEFYELPYQVSAEKIMEEIEKHQSNEKKPKFKEISEVKDLTDNKNGLRLVIYVKSGSNINSVIEELWNFTSCQSKFSVNNTVLINGRPHQNTNMLQLIEQFIKMRRSTFIRKSEYLVNNKLIKSAHKLEGIIKVLRDIDLTIEIIRKSPTSDEAMTKLMENFGITENQAKSILEMKLKNLTQSDKIELEQKYSEIVNEINRLTEILKSPELIDKELILELKETQKIINDDRRTTISGMTNEELALSAKEAQKQDKLLAKNVDCYLHILADNSILMTLDESIPDNVLPIKNTILTTSQANIFALLSNGEAKSVSVNSLSPGIPTKVDIWGIKEKQFVTLTTPDYDTLFVTNIGNGNIAKPSNKEIPITTLILSEEIVYAKAITQSDYDTKDLLLISEDGNLMKTNLSNIRRSGWGSGMIGVMKDSIVIGGALSTIERTELIITKTKSSIKVTETSDCPSKGRNTKGYSLHKLNNKDKIISIDVVPIGENKILDEDLNSFELPRPNGRATSGSDYKGTLFIGI